ncbi:hypothetical protein COCSUDRAFT_65991 [Coccomyxa subellipsoidea C-169]|uniref:Uncharacterized protein n=1 Tax=Coccomyxa subellipsoidea (strain C-169) TaxID=574566 RepID=I0YYV5_COCSC|nr:hypothetical protein COCSUDRAFT_65991 [Coccomyxa subellipsoidea C-169]EIE23574.1 hypothetical protein COCSUDRAFT_65991 [Coccomyxa subellipsoidea C-169]|eukprot:XP_005648118.1 hypothetical protein COCSUDRAFT_65991 [Coccomyxa subellipsoidea C-169]
MANHGAGDVAKSSAGLHERKVARRQAAMEAEMVSLREQYDSGSGKAAAEAGPAERTRADIRVEVPRAGDDPAPCPPKTSPSLSPGKAPPQAAAQDI